MKKLITKLKKQNLLKNKKIEQLLTYTILAAFLLAVVPAVTLQMQLYKFEKNLLQQQLEICEKQATQSTTKNIDNEEKEEEEEEFRSSAPKDTASINTVQSYFDAFNRGNLYKSCELIDDNKCLADNYVDIQRFDALRKNLVNGYENLHVWESEKDDDFHSDVVCVQYDYIYADDANQKKITELLSYYVNDGKITARVCEKVEFDGQKAECPILSARDFCL